MSIIIIHTLVFCYVGGWVLDVKWVYLNIFWDSYIQYYIEGILTSSRHLGTMGRKWMVMEYGTHFAWDKVLCVYGVCR